MVHEVWVPVTCVIFWDPLSWVQGRVFQFNLKKHYCWTVVSPCHLKRLSGGNSDIFFEVSTRMFGEMIQFDLLGQWLNGFPTFWDYMTFSRENKPFKLLFFQGLKWLSEIGIKKPSQFAIQF